MEIKDNNPELTYISEYEVLSCHCDPYSNLRASALCTFLQEIAWLHSEKMGIGWEDLMDQYKFFWALTRMKVKVYNPPQWGDIITIKTWSRGTDGVQFFRDWQVFDAQGNICAIGSSIWIIMSSETRKVQRTAFLAEKFPLQGEQVFPGKMKKIPALKNPEYSVYTPIKYSELDVNMHMNNVSYLIRFLDEESFEFRKEMQIDELELNFQHETTAGTFIKVGREKSESGVYLYNIVRKSDDCELCKGKVIWKPRER